MKLKVDREAILEGLQKVQNAVNPRATIPVLGNILFKAEKGKLWLTASDMDLSIRACVEAEVSKEGETTLPSRRVLGIFRELPGKEVEIEGMDRDVTRIRSQSANFTLNGISAEDFPPLPTLSSAKAFTLPQLSLRAMLQRTGYAVSKDESRPVLCGVLMSFRGGKLTVVSTDGRRLAQVEQELEFPKEAEIDLVVPPKTIAELSKALGSEGDVRLMPLGKQVAFDAGNTVVVSKLIEGTYPNYQQVIPAQSEIHFELQREEILNAVRRVALLTSEQSNSVKLTFAKDQLEISAVTPDVGEAHEHVAIKYGGKPITVSFNPEFIIEPLRALAADVVRFELTDEISPGVIRSNDPFLYVIMPMRMS